MDELILGITDTYGYTHDNSAVVLRKGKILFAGSEERYTRIKHDGSFPKQVIKASLKYLNLKKSSIKIVAVGYPKRKVLSILTNRYFFEIAPFLFSILVTRNVKIFGDLVKIIKLLYKKSKKITQPFLKNKKLVFIDHHLAHAASSYYTSGFDKCISIALDAFGSSTSGTIRSGAVYLCDKGEMKEVMSVPIFSSLGLFYQSVTYSLGFIPGDGEGKTMGLAAYGNYKKVYLRLKLYAPSFSGGNWMTGSDWLSDIIPSMPKLAYLFKATRFGSFLEKLLTCEKKENVAAAAQKILEEELLNLVKYLIKKYPKYKNICLSGGVFLNVKANKKILETPGVSNIFIHPHAGDGGVAMGAAFIATPKSYLRKILKQPLINCGLGESFSDMQVLKALKRYENNIIFTKQDNIINYTVLQLLKGRVIGWFQGRAEWGPRALGFRSVLADARDEKVKDRINEVLKNREWFMPFAPSVLEEGSSYFINFRRSPFMTIVFDIIPGREKLFPAAIHIDNTARPNSVNQENNPLYYRLLKVFYKKTGLPVILNTSFNRHGLPIVNSPEDAIDHLIMGAVDELIIGKYSIISNNQ